METTLGKLIEGTAGRDAIHMACAPMVADCYLRPGEDIGIVRDGVAGKCEPFVGIVDPFLKSAVLNGQKFWMVLYPKTVTGIRHHWTHPSFQDQPEDSARASVWITSFASRWKYSFEEFMVAAREYIRNDYDLDDKWEQHDVSDEDWSKFWEHFHTLTGLSINDKDKEFVKCCPN